jgi:hypothetical protein
MFVLSAYFLLLFLSFNAVHCITDDSIDIEFNNPLQPWNYPLLPTQSAVEKFRTMNELNVSTSLISKNVWMTLKEVPETLPENIAKLIATNTDWQFHILDDKAVTSFMNDHFANTSILWAYNLINPMLPAAKADIWRISTLWLYGGCYIDVDSFLKSSLTSVLEENDEIILGTERNEYRNHYHPNLTLSLVNSNASTFFKKQVVINWLMFSRPEHPILVRYLTNLILLMKREYFHKEVFPNARVHHSWQRLIYTTGPGMLTASVFEEVGRFLSNPSVKITTFENGSISSSHSYSSLHSSTTGQNSNSFNEIHKLETENASLVFRYAGTDFHHYGGVFKYFSKATYKDASESHYITRMTKGADLFLHYFDDEMKGPKNLRIWKPSSSEVQK